MKSDSQVSKLAKQIVELSLVNGLVQKGKLQHFVEILSGSEESVASDILAEVDRLVEKIEKESTLLIESAFEVDKGLLLDVQKYFEKKENKPLKLTFSLNPELIGGIRIKLGDFVWEKSVRSNLESIKETLSV